MKAPGQVALTAVELRDQQQPAACRGVDVSGERLDLVLEMLSFDLTRIGRVIEHMFVE